MDFYISKDSVTPVLRYPVSLEIDRLGLQTADFDNCAVTFSLMDDEGRYVVANRAATLEITDRLFQTIAEEKYDYTLAFTFTRRDTRHSGVFRGEFKVDFLTLGAEGKITFPQRDTIHVYIRESSTKTDVIR